MVVYRFLSVCFVLCLSLFLFVSVVFARGNDDVGAQEVLVQCFDLEEGRDLCYASLCEYDPGYLCAEDVLDVAVVTVGPEKAVVVLRDIMASSLFAIRTDGHLLAHVIGRSTSRVFGSTGEQFLRCPHDFNDGCYHGFFEDTLTKVDDPVAVAISICENMPFESTSDKEKSYCYHGAGHVFLMNESHNLDTAMSHCISVPEEWHDVCLSGVFMENAWPTRGWEEKNKNFRQDDPLYPCNAIEERFRPTCYAEHYSYLMYKHVSSFEGLVEICFDAGENVRDCLSGIGLMLQNSQRTDIVAESLGIVDWDYMEKIIFLCNKFPDRYKGSCYFPLVGALLNFDYPDMGRVITFCSGIEEEHRSACFRRAGSYLNHLGNEVVKQQSCIMVPPEYQGDCLDVYGDKSGVVIVEQMDIVDIDQTTRQTTVLFFLVKDFFAVLFGHIMHVFTQSVQALGVDLDAVETNILIDKVERCLDLMEGKAECYASLCEYEPGYLCAESILNSATEHGGPELGMRILSEMIPSAPFPFSIGDEGHGLAHVVGRRTAEYFGDTGEMFLKCPTIFDYGCNHGFLEVALVKSFSPVEAVTKICESLPEKPEIGKPNCYHGSGHGVMMNASYDLREALAICDGVPDSYGCWSGVFMENVSGYITRRIVDLYPQNNSFHDDDPHVPCNVVDEKYREICYRVHMPYLGEFFKYDLQLVLDTCLDAGEYIQDCVYSFGWHILFEGIQNQFISDPTMNFIEKSIYLCNQFPEEYWEICYLPAINQISVSYGAERTFEFCEKIDVQYMQACYREIGRRLDDLILYEEEKLQACAPVLDKYKGDCLGTYQDDHENGVGSERDDYAALTEPEAKSRFFFSEVTRLTSTVLRYMLQLFSQSVYAQRNEDLKGVSLNIHDGVERCLSSEEDRDVCFASLCVYDSGYLCAESIVDSVTALEGPEKGIQVLQEVATSPRFFIDGDLHQLAHVVGRSSAQNFGGTGDVFNRCPVEFDYGCYHGFLEDALLQTVSSVEVLQGICESSGKVSHDKNNCYHGGGHGVMMNESYDLEKALSICDVLPSHQSDCRSGVFMENAMGFVAGRIPVENNTFLPDDPLAPCNTLEEHRNLCYIYHHRIYLPYAYSALLDDLVGLCLNAPEEDVTLCFSGLFESFIKEGNDVIISEVFLDFKGNRPEKAAFLCNQLPIEIMQMCHVTVVDSFMHGLDRLKDVVGYCRLLDTELKQACFIKIAQKLYHFVGDTEHVLLLCEIFPEEYQFVCLENTDTNSFSDIQRYDAVGAEFTLWFQKFFIFFSDILKRIMIPVFAQTSDGLQRVLGGVSYSISSVFQEGVEQCLSLKEDRDACYASLCGDVAGQSCAANIVQIVAFLRGPQAATEALHEILFGDVTVLADPQVEITALHNKKWHNKFDIDPAYGHNLLRFVGVVTAQQFGLTAESILKCPFDFDYGCQRGFLEYALLNVDSPPTVITTLCENMPDVPNAAKGNCYYGAGHGLMLRYDYDLDKSLSWCDKVGGDQSSCWFGVFYENMFAFIDGRIVADKKNGFRIDDPLAPCNRIDDMYRYMCYKTHALYLISYYENDLEKVIASCVDGVEEKYKEVCVEAVGANIRVPNVQESLSDFYAFEGNFVEKSVYFCNKFPDVFRMGCYMGIIRQNVIDYGIDGVLRVCENIEKKYKKECWQVVGQRIGNISSDEEENHLFCSAAPEKYKNDCLTGRDGVFSGDDGMGVVVDFSSEEQGGINLLSKKIVNLLDVVFTYVLQLFTQPLYAQESGDLGSISGSVDYSIPLNIRDGVDQCLYLDEARDVCFASLCKYEPGWLCAEDIIAALSFVVTPEEALTELHVMVWGDAFIFDETGGHTLAHVIGRVIAQKFGVLGSVFLMCPIDFDYGCQHGFVEYALGKMNSPVKVVKQMCESMPDVPHIAKGNCYHGAGHALMMNYSYDLYGALEKCDKLDEKYDGYCETGVFMENVNGYLGDRIDSYSETSGFQDDDPLAPCNRVADRHKEWCYVSHAPYIMAFYGNDLEKIVEACVNGPVEDYKSSCVYSVGSYSRIPQSQRNLLKDFDFEEDSIGGSIFVCNQFSDRFRVICYKAVLNQNLIDFGFDNVSSFCDRVDGVYKKECWQIIGRQLGSILSSESERSKLCEAAPEIYQRDCLGTYQDDHENGVGSERDDYAALTEPEAKSRFFFSEVTRLTSTVLRYMLQLFSQSVYAQRNEDLKGVSLNIHDGVERCLSSEEDRDVCFASLCVYDSGYLCAESIVDSVTALEGPEKGIQVLQEVATSPRFFIDGDLHQLAHVVGRSSAQNFGGTGDVFNRCPVEFGYGCQHGFFENTMLSAQSPIEALVSICETSSTSSFESYERENCYHGGGHGVMMNESYDLEKALSICDELLGDRQSDCWGGVFMENVGGFVGGRIEEEFNSFKPDVPLAPCNVVEDRYRDGCYLYHYVYLVEAYSTSPQDLLKLCLSAEGHVESCLQGVIRAVQAGTAIEDSSEAVEDSVERIVFFCNRFPAEYAHSCHESAVIEIIYPDWSNSLSSSLYQSLQYCGFVDDVYKKWCFMAIGERLNHFIRNESERSKLCEAAPEIYQGDCLGTYQDDHENGVGSERDDYAALTEPEAKSRFFFSEVTRLTSTVLRYMLQLFSQSVYAQRNEDLKGVSLNIHDGVERCLSSEEDRDVCFASLCVYDSGYLCAESIVDSVTALEGPEKGIQVLQEVATSPRFFIDGDLHQLAHVVGRSSAQNFGGTGDVFNRCPVEFDYGCYHGFLEDALLQTVSSVEVLQGICESSGKVSHDKNNCYHGGGHGVMMNESYDLEKALSICDVLPSHQSDCRSGVFMENAMGFVAGRIPVENNTFLPDDPLAPCNTLEEHRNLCYIYHHRIYLPYAYSALLDDLVGLCLNAPEEDVTLCFSGLSHAFTTIANDIISHESFSDLKGDRLERAAFLCSQLPNDYIALCYRSAASRLVRISIEKGLESAMYFCNFAAEYRQVCFMAVNQELDHLIEDKYKMIDLCEVIPEKYSVDCLGVYKGFHDSGVEYLDFFVEYIEKFRSRFISLFLRLVRFSTSFNSYLLYEEKEKAGGGGGGGQVVVIGEDARDKFIDDVVTQRLNTMSLDEKIGQMLMIGLQVDWLFHDSHMENMRDMIENYHIGGVILSGDNIYDRKHVTHTIKRLQEWSKIPLFIGVDQEGAVIRLDFLHEVTPQYKIKDILQARKVAIMRAKELREVGVTMNFSPVLEYTHNSASFMYYRTFQVDPETTGMLGSAMVDGYFQGGIIPVVKHFPGHGESSADSHYFNTSVPWSLNEVDTYLWPFRDVIEVHPTVPVMTAHVSVPSVSTDQVTCSTVFLSDILREQMGHKGVIITDALNMSICDTLELTAVMAINAGVDILLPFGESGSFFNYLKQVVLEGGISEARIDESVARILALKFRMEGFGDNVQYDVFGGLGMSVDSLWELVNSDDWLVRRNVASNSELPADMLQVLARDSELYVLLAVAGNSSTPVELLWELAGNSSVEVQSRVVENLSVPQDLLRRLATSKDWKVRRNIAMNQGVPKDVLVEFAEDDDWRIRLSVVKNPKTSTDVLQKLIKDENVRVRYYAEKFLHY